MIHLCRIGPFRSRFQPTAVYRRNLVVSMSCKEPLLPTHSIGDGAWNNRTPTSIKRDYSNVHRIHRSHRHLNNNTQPKVGWFKRIKNEIKQYTVLWFIIYWVSFVPLFMLFMIPYYSGIDCVGWLSWLQKKGWMEWTKQVGVDTEKLIQRVENDDDFRIDTLGWTIRGSTANLLLTTILIWEVCKPARYLFYLFLCRQTVKFCRARQIFPKFFRKY